MDIKVDEKVKAETLLTTDDPDVFEVVNPNADAPLIICCDHAGQCVPAALNDLGLSREMFELHIAHDIGARQVSKLLAEKCSAPALLANYSRLVIDLNRNLDDATLCPPKSDGIAILGNADLDAAQHQQRIDELFFPYHRYYGEMVDRLQTRSARPVILSVHSFTPQFQGVDRPWDVGLLWDKHKDLAHAFADHLHAAASDLRIGHNQPYHARDPLGYAMYVHAQTRDVEMLLVEIRQDLIADVRGQEWAADLLHRALVTVGVIEK